MVVRWLVCLDQSIAAGDEFAYDPLVEQVVGHENFLALMSGIFVF